VSFACRSADGKERDFKLGCMRPIVSVSPSWPAHSFVRFLNRRTNDVFSGCSGGFGGSAGRERSAFSHHGVLRIVCRAFFRKASVLRPVIMRDLSVLFCCTLGFVVGAMPRLSTSVLCISGDPTFGDGTLGGD
jgi:hypothetical protein